MARRRRGQRREAAGESRPPRVLPMLGLSLVLLVGGWTALWLFARHEALMTFARWRASERAFGRAWTCPDEHIGGFPLGITLRCTNPTFAGPVGDGLFQGNLAGFTADARIYFPTNVTVQLAAPFTLTEVAGPRRLEARWSTAALTLRGVLPADLGRGQLEMADLSLGPPPVSATVAHLLIGFRPISHTPDARVDLDTTITVEDARIPALDAALGSADPIDAKLSGFATQVAFTGGATLPDLLDPWIAAGGQLHVQNLDLSKGAFQVHAAGRLSLDEEHRPQGRLDAGFSGLDPVAARLGLPVEALKMGGVLSGLLGGAASTADGSPPADLQVPVIAKDGRLMLGPVATGLRLAPLY